jgi:hypothetical protein
MLRFTTLLACCLVVLLVSGCVVQPIPPPAASTPEAASEEAATAEPESEEATSSEVDTSMFTEESLSNMEYELTSIMSGTVQLTDGQYEDTANMITVNWVDTYALGDLNGVGSAAVILLYSGGGSGTFSILAVVQERDGEQVNVADTMIGDRVTMNSISIADNEIVLDLVTQGPDDAMCCATQRMLASFALQDDQLTESSAEVTGVQEQLSETQVITFTPEVIPTETQAGSCFSNAIGLGRADAWRCTTDDNVIHDPCFQVDDAPTIVCDADPVTGAEGFVLELSEPLPAVDVGNVSQFWKIELASGTICGLMTGTIPGVGDQVAPYGCADEAQSYLMEDIDMEFTVWWAQDVVFDLGDDGFVIRSSTRTPVRTVWR